MVLEQKSLGCIKYMSRLFEFDPGKLILKFVNFLNELRGLGVVVSLSLVNCHIFDYPCIHI